MKKIMLLLLVASFAGVACIPFAKQSFGEDGACNNRFAFENAVAEASSPTVLDWASILINKDEHYPISNLFIEEYQQASGGYIDKAKQEGRLVDKSQHEPNQKWHFFVSWLDESLTSGTTSWEDDARSVIYIRLKCPELLLWIYEATGVETSKIQNAYDVAVQGKIDGENVATIAKNMRECVTWDDILPLLSESL